MVTAASRSCSWKRRRPVDSSYIERLRCMIEQKKRLRGAWTSQAGIEDNERQIAHHEAMLADVLAASGVA